MSLFFSFFFFLLFFFLYAITPRDTAEKCPLLTSLSFLSFPIQPFHTHITLFDLVNTVKVSARVDLPFQSLPIAIYVAYI